ncbi:hypothetical protein P4S95_17470 [Aneurinibacillus aneurinilyticus]|uniref:hypothetical protein n=1 Tax=Aneurinibacillus aneurinilyticus TaxID=1391 RepID=UPI002E238B23|nr:hypothetical protein [Aneurinibacillus aneurinilyticus]
MSAQPFAFIYYIFNMTRNEKGASLVELLTATAIFLAIILPLSSYYISSISLYDQTRVETDLQNETDFLLSTILNTVQDASYFELDGNTTDVDSDLLSIFSHDLAGQNLLPVSEKASVHPGIKRYNLQRQYYKADAQADDIQKTILTRISYGFNVSDKNDVQKSFEYNSSSYLANGIFALDEEKQVLTVYLLVAPRGNGTIQNGQKSAFLNVAEVLNELDRLRSERVPDDKAPLHFIRIIKTSFAVTNLKRG